MLENSFDISTNVVFPIVGGVIAGGIVVLIEWIFRLLYDWNQRRKGTKAIGRFFAEWEDAINSSADLPAGPNGQTVARDQIQFIKHKYYIRAVHFTISRWSRYLSDGQTQEINLFLFRHEHSEIGILPDNRIFNQEVYDRLFQRAREIKWLKF